jgi:WD40 repeat protein
VALPSFSEFGGYVDLYDPTSGELVKRLTVPNDGPLHVRYLTFSADGSLVFADFHGSFSKLWDVQSGQLMREYSGDDHTRFDPYFRLSPNGKLVAVVAWDSEQLWWDVTTGERVKFPSNMVGQTVEFSPDGSLFAVGTDQVQIWDLEQKQIIRSLDGHIDRIESMAFSPDNRLLLTGSVDKTAKLWDISTGELLRVFRGHNAAITKVAFSSDGKQVVTASMDKTIRTWNTDYNDLLVYACTRVGRDLTQEERTRYGVTGQDATCPQFGNLSQPLSPTATPLLTPTLVQPWTPIPTPTPGNP